MFGVVNPIVWMTLYDGFSVSANKSLMFFFNRACGVQLTGEYERLESVVDRKLSHLRSLYLFRLDNKLMISKHSSWRIEHCTYPRL